MELDLSVREEAGADDPEIVVGGEGEDREEGAGFDVGEDGGDQEHGVLVG